MTTKKVQIGVIGPDIGTYPKGKRARETLERAAELLGRLIAERGAVLFTGGTGGTMKAACRGAKRANGITVGFPGRDRFSSNPYIDIEVLTDIDAGSFMFAGLLGCDALIVLPGGAGTLSELCLAYRKGKPCIVIKGFNKQYDGFTGGYLDGTEKVAILGAQDPKEAVKLAFETLKAGGKTYKDDPVKYEG
jgi:hypothetical protein